MLIPLYGFLEGDTIGLLIVADESETVLELGGKLQQAAEVRVVRKAKADVWYRKQVVDPELTLAQAGFEPLERFDVIQKND